VYLGVAVPMGKGIAQCAHNKLPLLTPVRIVNMITGFSVVAIVTDRGKFGPGVVVDLNYPLFAMLANPILGWCPVRIDTLGH
jgi:rare lipoprotein A (peptidoglycan hydrolase)